MVTMNPSKKEDDCQKGHKVTRKFLLGSVKMFSNVPIPAGQDTAEEHFLYKAGK